MQLFDCVYPVLWCRCECVRVFLRGSISVGQHGQGVISALLDTRETDHRWEKAEGNQHTGCSAEFVSVPVPSRSIALCQEGRRMRLTPTKHKITPFAYFLPPQFLQFSPTYQFIQTIWDHRSRRQAGTPSLLPLMAKHSPLMDRMVYYHFNHS